MGWSDAARAAAAEARRRNAFKRYGASRPFAAKALRKARKLTVGMKHRAIVTRRYAYQIIKKGG
jgi:hypothetical protein